MTDLHINYITTAYDYTGYGEAAREYIKALLANNVGVSIRSTNLVNNSSMTDCSFETLEVLRKLEAAPLEGDINFIHMAPNFYKEKAVPGKINIGSMYWETSHIPAEWAADINTHMTAMIVCCNYIKEALVRSGVTVPIDVVPPAFDVNKFDDLEYKSVTGMSEDTFKFYSIFTWNPRKNPEDLLTAYFTEFKVEEPVLLIVKSYSGDESRSKLIIKQSIEAVKKGLGLITTPRIAFVWQLLTEQEIMNLHQEGDCFVLASRSEGLGVPHVNATLAGNPAIASNYGSIPETMGEGNFYPIRCNETPVSGMPWIKEYDGTQVWGNPDVMDLRSKMRYVYENVDQAQQVQQKASEFVREKYNYQVVGKILAETINKYRK